VDGHHAAAKLQFFDRLQRQKATFRQMKLCIVRVTFCPKFAYGISSTAFFIFEKKFPLFLTTEPQRKYLYAISAIMTTLEKCCCLQIKIWRVVKKKSNKSCKLCFWKKNFIIAMQRTAFLSKLIVNRLFV